MLVKRTDLIRVERAIAKEGSAYWFNEGDDWYISESHFVLRVNKDIFDYLKKKLDGRKRKIEWRELGSLKNFFMNIDGILVRDRKPGKLPDKREVLVLEQSTYKVVIDRSFIVTTDGQYLFYTNGTTKPVYQVIGDYELVNMILPIANPEVIYD